MAVPSAWTVSPHQRVRRAERGAPRRQDDSARPQLREPRRGDPPHPAGGDDPVVRGGIRHTEGTVAGHHPRVQPDALQGPPGGPRHPLVDLHRGDVLLAEPVREQTGVPAGARADLKDPHPRRDVQGGEHGRDQRRGGGRTRGRPPRCASAMPAVVPLGDHRLVRLGRLPPHKRLLDAVHGDRVALGLERPDQLRQKQRARQRVERGVPSGGHDTATDRRGAWGGSLHVRSSSSSSSLR